MNKHGYTKYVALALCLACLLGMSAPGMAAAGDDVGASANVSGGTGSAAGGVTAITGAGIVNVDAYIYAEASKASRKIVMLSKNIQVTYTGESGNFYQITYTNAAGKTYTGFMEKTALNAVDPNAKASTGASSSSLTRNVKAGTSQPSSYVTQQLANAKATNSDVVGYIYIAGTNIAQPILFNASSVHYYTNHDIKKNKDKAGTVYTFYNALYRNNVVTGHNMRGSNRLFHQLHHLQEKALGYTQCQHSKCPSRDLSTTPDLKVAANRVWEISLLGYNKWEVWAMYEVKKNEPKSTLNTNIHPLAGYSDKQVQAWIDNQLSRSEISFGTSISATDTLMTIYTCGTEYDSSSAQSRLYFFLKAVG